MDGYQLEVAAHPSQARFGGKPLFDDDGKPVPLFPNQRSIRLDGKVIALFCATSFIFTVNGIPEVIKEQAEVLALEVFPGIPKISQVPESEEDDKLSDD